MYNGKLIYIEGLFATIVLQLLITYLTKDKRVEVKLQKR